MDDFGHILTLLASSVVIVSLFHRMHLPPILGYLFVGMLVGPGGFGWIPSLNDMEELAEFGVVFLMFTLGLEFSIPRLMSMKRTLLGVGGTQVLICTIVGGLIAFYFGLSVNTAIVVAAALTLSSTAVVVKQLTEQNEHSTQHGQLSISILIFQDIAAVVFLIVIPALAGDVTNSLSTTVLLTIGKGIAVFVGLAVVGQWILRPLFHEVAKARSTELFMLATLLVALSAAGVTHYLSLSMALGSFLAGLMLGETEFRHQIEIDIRPFQDVLLGLFFITVGALFDVKDLPQHWHYVLLILFALIGLKTALIFLCAALVGKVNRAIALRAGIILAQGGEFGFVVLTEAIKYRIIDPEQRQVIFAAVVLSIVTAPLLIRFNKRLAAVFFQKDIGNPKTPSQYHLETHASELKNHVIICGYGRVGQILTRFLDQENIPSIALDLDPERISKSKMAGEKTFYGDATHPATLAAAGLSRARMLVITFSDEAPALETLKHVRSLRLDLPIFVRTRDDSNLDAFQQAGATEVVPESLEGSLMLASHLLLTLGVPTSKIIFKIRRVHSDRYRILQGFFKGSDDAGNLFEDQDASRRTLYSITVPENAYATNKTIRSIIDPDMEFSIKALTRNAIRYPEPHLDMEIKSGDVLVVYATPESIYLLEEKILRGF